MTKNSLNLGRANAVANESGGIPIATYNRDLETIFTALNYFQATIDELAANCVTSANIVDGTIVSGDIANATITGGNIASATITATNITNATITATQIANATITTTQISGTAGITGGQIASATITGGNIASATITATNITNATITATQIANATITTTQISGTAGITGSQIASATITGSNIGSATITSTNIANATITATQIANATITSAQIAANTITGANIASTTIAAGNIANLTITAAQIANLTITGGQIANYTVTEGKTKGVKGVTKTVFKGTGLTGDISGDYNTGDYASDDLAIQAAINAVNVSGGGTVRLLAGNFNGCANDMVLKSNVVIQGQGSGSTILNKGFSGNGAISHVGIEDIYFASSNLTPTSGNNTDIWIYGCAYPNLNFVNTTTIDIQSNLIQPTVESCGINLNTCSDINIIGNTFYNAVDDPDFNYGLGFVACSKINVNNNLISSLSSLTNVWRYGIKIMDCVGDNDINISGNTIMYCKSGIALFRNKNLRIFSNLISLNKDYGIYVYNYVSPYCVFYLDLLITNCEITNNTCEVYIWLNTNVGERAILKYNRVIANSSGIYLAHGDSGSVIQEHNITGATYEQHQGFVLESACDFNTQNVINSGDFGLVATKKLILDTQAGHSYIVESADGVVDLYAAATKTLSLASTGVSVVGNITMSTASATVDGVDVSANINQAVLTTSSPTFANITNSAMTSGSVLFAGTGGLISQDNVNLNWDNTNKCLTRPTESSCKVYIPTTNQTMADGTLVIVNFTAETYDDGDDWNTSTKLFTCPVTGKYLVTAQLTFHTTIIGVVYEAEIYYDGSLVAYDYKPAAVADYLSVNISYVVKGVAGKTIGIYAEHSTSAVAVDIIKASYLTWATIDLIH